MADKLNPNSPARYQIIVQGMLSDKWSDWFGKMEIMPLKNESGNIQTMLTGNVLDQAELQGMLNKLQDLGLPLISLRCVGDEK